jgi:hypothetical protein
MAWPTGSGVDANTEPSARTTTEGSGQQQGAEALSARDYSEVSTVAQTVGPEVLVEREDGPQVTGFGDRDEAGVGEVHRMIAVALHQFGAAER